MRGHTEADRGSTGAARRASPLARGALYRLAWAGGLSAILWLAVLWALT